MSWQDEAHDLYVSGMQSRKIAKTLKVSVSSVEKFLTNSGVRCSFAMKFDDAVAFVSQHVNMEAMTSYSYFYRDKLARGIVIEVVCAITHMQRSTVSEKFGYSHSRFLPDFTYAQQKAPEHIAHLVKLYHDTRARKNAISLSTEDRSAA